MKYLIVLIVVLVAVMLWRGNRRTQRQARDAAAPGRPQGSTGSTGQPQDMVRCPVCALHLPRSDALAGPDGQLYCSNEHRQRARG